MDLSAIVVVGLLTLSFFGFAIWAAFHSRRDDHAAEASKAKRNVEMPKT